MKNTILKKKLCWEEEGEMQNAQLGSRVKGVTFLWVLDVLMLFI